MPKIFIIEDQIHAAIIGEFASLEDAWDELLQLSTLSWDQIPNVAPCQSWKTCGREYEIIEYETGSLPWEEIRRLSGLEVNAGGTVWGPDSPHNCA